MIPASSISFLRSVYVREPQRYELKFEMCEREASEDKRHSIESGWLSARERKAKIYELYLPLMKKITIILYRGYANHMQWNIIHPHFSSFEETLAGFIHQKNGKLFVSDTFYIKKFISFAKRKIYFSEFCVHITIDSSRLY